MVWYKVDTQFTSLYSFLFICFSKHVKTRTNCPQNSDIRPGEEVVNMKVPKKTKRPTGKTVKHKARKEEDR